MHDTPRPGFGSRLQRAFTRVLVTLLVLGMAGAVAFLLAQLNARTFTLAEYNGQLVVMKGRMLPWGAVPYQPNDARLAETYAPIPLEGQTVTTLLTQRFTDRDELDRALFPLLETLARPRIASDEPQAINQGVYYLHRAERLAGLSEDQRTRLKGLLVEVAYYQARLKLDEARRIITEAMGQLKLASEGDSRHARSATQMLSKVTGPTQALDQALAEAVNTLSAPRSKESQEPAPQPTEAPPTEAPPTGPAAPGAVITDSDTQARPPDANPAEGDAGGDTP